MTQKTGGTFSCEILRQVVWLYVSSMSLPKLNPLHASQKISHTSIFVFELISGIATFQLHKIMFLELTSRKLHHTYSFVIQRVAWKNYLGMIFLKILHMFLNRVQQTVSGSAPPQHPPDTMSWTLLSETPSCGAKKGSETPSFPRSEHEERGSLRPLFPPQEGVSDPSLCFFSLVFLFPWCFSCCEIPWSFWVFLLIFQGF